MCGRSSVWMIVLVWFLMTVRIYLNHDSGVGSLPFVIIGTSHVLSQLPILELGTT